MRIKDVVVLVVPLVILGAVVYGVWGLFAKDEPEASGEPLASMRDFEELCHSRKPKYFPDVAAYEGRGRIRCGSCPTGRSSWSRRMERIVFRTCGTLRPSGSVRFSWSPAWRGRGRDGGGCPPFIYRRSTDDSGFHMDLDSAELLRTLGRYVE